MQGVEETVQPLPGAQARAGLAGVAGPPPEGQLTPHPPPTHLLQPLPRKQLPTTPVGKLVKFNQFNSRVVHLPPEGAAHRLRGAQPDRPTRAQALPSLSTHLRVSGWPWCRRHISRTSSQSSSKVVAESRLVIRMSLGQKGCTGLTMERI